MGGVWEGEIERMTAGETERNNSRTRLMEDGLKQSPFCSPGVAFRTGLARDREAEQCVCVCVCGLQPDMKAGMEGRMEKNRETEGRPLL